MFFLRIVSALAQLWLESVAPLIEGTHALDRPTRDDPDADMRFARMFPSGL